MRTTKYSIAFFFALHFLTVSVKAQNSKSISLPGIPFPCYWENEPKSFSTKENGFQISSGPKTDMFRDPNATYNTDNAPKVLFQPDSNFVLSASIEHTFESKWDGGAIVLKADSANWIKFCFEKDYTGAHRVVSVVTKNISDDCNSIAVNSNSISFKIAKAGKVITLYASQDGRQWLLIRHLQFESAKPLKLGFLAQSPTGETCTVNFSAVRYEAKTIKDPYTGE